MMKTLSSRWFAFVATVVVHGIATAGRARFSVDTWTYIQLADGFRAHDFSGTFKLAAVLWTKTIYITLLALARGVSPAHWTILILALNVLCSGAVAVMLVDLARRATRWPAAPVLALLFYVAGWEVFQWVRYVLTDIPYCAAAFVPFYLVARRIVVEGEPRRPLLLAVALLVAIFTRPPGLVLIPLALFVELVLVERRVSGRVAAAIIIVVAAAVLLVRTIVVNDPSRWPFRFVKPIITLFSAREKGGEVVMDMKQTFRPPVRTAADHLIIVADRFVRFFQLTSGAYSRAHNLFNVLWFVPLYGLGIIGAVEGLRRGDRRRRSLVIALLTWVGVFAFLHALTVLDYDWRFRLPLIPHLILLAACGADALATAWLPGVAEPDR